MYMYFTRYILSIVISRKVQDLMDDLLPVYGQADDAAQKGSSCIVILLFLHAYSLLIQLGTVSFSRL